MRDGAVVQIGTPAEIVARPADDHVRDFVTRGAALPRASPSSTSCAPDTRRLARGARHWPRPRRTAGREDPPWPPRTRCGWCATASWSGIVDHDAILRVVVAEESPPHDRPHPRAGRPRRRPRRPNRGPGVPCRAGRGCSPSWPSGRWPRTSGTAGRPFTCRAAARPSCTTGSPSSSATFIAGRDDNVLMQVVGACWTSSTRWSSSRSTAGLGPGAPPPVPQIGWLGVLGILGWISLAVAGLAARDRVRLRPERGSAPGYWSTGMDTLVLTLVAVTIRVAVGVPLAVLGGDDPAERRADPGARPSCRRCRRSFIPGSCSPLFLQRLGLAIAVR